MDWIQCLYVDMSQPSSYAELAAMHLDQRPVKGIVQPPVKPPEGKLHRNTNLLQFLLNVVLDICKHDYSWPFRKPVDSLYLKIPDYHTIIKHPMDFNTIGRRIQNFFYYDINECIRDIRLIFYNCYLYNRPDTDIYSMAKTIEKIFVEAMGKCTEMEVEIPMLIKSSKSREKGGKREIATVKTEAYDAKTLTTSPSYQVVRNLKPSQYFASALSASTSQTYNQTAFMSISQANNTTTLVPTNQMNVTSQLWTCPRCHYHSEKSEYFMQKTSVGRTSIIHTRKQSAQSLKKQVRERSSSCSSDSSSSSDDFEKEIEEMKEKVKKLTEALEHLNKEFIENKKRKLERQKEWKLKKKLSHAPVVKQKAVCHNKSALVSAIPKHSVSASTSLNKASKNLQNLKKTQKNSSKQILAPKPAAGTKKSTLKRNFSPKPAALSKKGKINCNPPKKQLSLPALACIPPPPVSRSTTNGGFRMKMEDADLKPIPYEEKSKLSEELLKLDENATAAVSTIIKLMEAPFYDAASTELELDLDALKPSTLKELRKYVDNLKKQTQTSSSIDANDSSHKTQNSLKEKKKKEYSDDDSTSSSTSCTSDDSSESCMFYSDESSSSSNTLNDGKTNSSANDESTITTNAAVPAHPDSTTSPVIVDPNPAFYFPNFQQTVIKSEPDFEECKSSFPSPCTSRPVPLLNNYTRLLHGPPKESTNRVEAMHTPEVDRPYGYTRITKRAKQAEKKAQFDLQNQRLMDSVEKAKKLMKMREKMKSQVRNKADQPGQGGMKINKQV